MSGASYGEALRQTRALFETGAVGGLTDGELLARFVSRPGDPAEAAFAALVERHGPMVLRACSATIGDEHEAHDAFQATFLVLARKAGTIRAADSVGPWLHEVARRVSACARSASARRGRHERQAAERSSRAVAASEVDDLAPVLHEEIDRLPERYRAAIVLCDLEGLTHEQAAARLGWPLGTVRSRLARGRDRLRGRLTRRGLAPSATLPALPALSDAAVEATARLASGGPVPLTIRLLTDGGLRAMRLIRWKAAAMLTLAIGLAASGAGVLARRSLGQLPGQPTRTGRADEKPQATRASAENFPGEDQVIVRVAPSGTKVWAFSPATHAWRTYHLPEGVKVPGYRSRVGGNISENPPTVFVDFPDDQVLAPAMAGEEIREVAVFNVPTGEWVRQPLKEPAHGTCRPYDGRRFVLYRVGRYLYGFSAATGRWDVRDIGEDADKDKHVGVAKAGIQTAGGDGVAADGKLLIHSPGSFRGISLGPKKDQSALIRVGRYICGFSVPTGTWDVLDLGADNDNAFPVDPQPTDPTILVPRGDHLYHFNAAKGRFQDIESDEKSS